MSYPDLGCLAECLTCELCDELGPGMPPDPEFLPDFDAFDDIFPEDGGPFGDGGLWAPASGDSSDPLGDFLDSLPNHNVLGSGLDLSIQFGDTVGIEIKGRF